MSDQIISQEGYNKLKEELDYLVKTKRKEIAARIETAKELGDLSENAEYQEAKEAQGFNEKKIAEVTSMLKNLTVVEVQKPGDKISMGSKITAAVNGEEKRYQIVSFNEADPASGKISNESPLGMAFAGKKAGDKVMVNTPKGEVKYEIIRVE